MAKINCILYSLIGILIFIFISCNKGDIVTVPNNVTNEILHYNGMVISFNADLHIPNWVAWELTKEELNRKIKGQKKCHTDNAVRGCAVDADYIFSGYSRGHMVPKGDMRWSEEAYRDVMYFTNIAPQNQSFNNGAWRNLEELCRKWVKNEQSIIIICGPIISDISEYIGDNRVAVPKRFFKVIYSLDNAHPKGLGFLFNNDEHKVKLEDCVVTIDSVEAVTEYDFLQKNNTANSIESKCDIRLWKK